MKGAKQERGAVDQDDRRFQCVSSHDGRFAGVRKQGGGTASIWESLGGLAAAGQFIVGQPPSQQIQWEYPASWQGMLDRKGAENAEFLSMRCPGLF